MILHKAIGILRYWKQELESQYSDFPLCLLASYDDELRNSSMTLRFWADRSGKGEVELDDLED